MNRFKRELSLRASYHATTLRVLRAYYAKRPQSTDDRPPYVMYGIFATLAVVVLFSLVGLLIKDSASDSHSYTSVSNDKSHVAVDAPLPQSNPSSNTASTSESELANDEPTSVQGIWYTVDRVIDGDTIRVFYNGQSTKVRFIGIDTPETSETGQAPECYGREASMYVKNIVHPGDSVRLVSDSSQGDLDRYGRLLRYVYLKDGSNLAETTILNGYGKEYTYANAYKLQSAFDNAETQAKQKNAGLWAVCV